MVNQWINGFLVHSGCSSKILLTGWLINTSNWFFIVLKPGNLQSGCSPGRVLAKALFGLADFSMSPHMVEGIRELSGVSFTRALIPFRAPPSWLKPTWEYHHLWGLEFYHMNLGVGETQMFRLKLRPKWLYFRSETSCYINWLFLLQTCSMSLKRCWLWDPSESVKVFVT